MEASLITALVSTLGGGLASIFGGGGQDADLDSAFVSAQERINANYEDIIAKIQGQTKDYINQVSAMFPQMKD